MNRKVVICFLVVSILLLLDRENVYNDDMTDSENDYYIEISTCVTGAVVSLNGFEIIKTVKGSKIVARVVTSYLVNGKNKLETFFIPPSSSTLNSSLSIKLISTAAGERMSSKEAKILFEKEYCNRSLRIASLKVNEDIYVGKGDLDGRKVFFLKDGNSVSWSCRLKDELSFKRVPSSLSYINLNNLISDVKVIFSDSISKGELVFSDLKFGPHSQTIVLDRNKISKGKIYLSGYSFDSIMINGNVENNNETELRFLEINEFEG